MTTLTLTAPSPHLSYLLRLADDQLVLGHRLSEWTGHAPALEEDIALANVALDHIGAARMLFDRAAEVHGDGLAQDDYAYRRDAPGFRNALLVERPNGDFAHTIVRQFFFSAFALPLWRALTRSTDETLAAIAAKCEKEAQYHVRHAGDWFVRLGDGTEESRRRTEDAVVALWRYTGELFEAALNGRIDGEKVAAFMRHVVPLETVDHFLLCGPSEFLDGCIDALSGLGASDDSILVERFTAPGGRPQQTRTDTNPDTEKAELAITLDGVTTRLGLSPGERVLDAALAAGLDVPFSCRAGMCCTCRAKVVEGEISMAANYSLRADDVADGFVLACQSTACSPRVAIDYDAS